MLIEHLPREAATTIAQHGPDAAWGLAEHLQAAAIDALQQGNWQRGGDPKAPRPKPFPRPGVVPDTTRHGATTLPPDKVAAWFHAMKSEEEVSAGAH